MDAKNGDSPYENARKHRLEENKKRLQELGLAGLSNCLSKSLTPTKSPGQSRRGKPSVLREKVKVQLRRSKRNSTNPQPDYQEVEIDIRRRARFENTGSARYYSRLYERKYASEEARMSATNKAEAIKEGLPLTNASFVKPMLQSHVTGGFWLGLPAAFCKDCLPKKDDRIVLEDENNEEWETIYLANKTGLSGGWRGFSLDHGLVDGDALVFELVQPRRFKVHIVRNSEPNASTVEGDEKIGEQPKEKAQTAAEKLSSTKVRQRLVWETGLEKGNEIEEKADSEEAEMEGHPNKGIMKEQGRKKRKDKREDEIVGLFDVRCNEHHDSSKKGKDITSYLKSRKPLDAIREPKKEMQTSSDGIEVC